MNEVKDVEYLQKYPTTGAYSLKRNHKHYQLIGCLGLTGEVWSEFFVQCKKEFHYVKEYITMLLFSEITQKLHHFYFNYYLPLSVAKAWVALERILFV